MLQGHSLNKTVQELRQTAKFAQYGLAASSEALKDAGFEDGKGLDPEMTGVCLGSGIGNLEELYDTSVAYAQQVSKPPISPPQFGGNPWGGGEGERETETDNILPLIV